jgi:sugar lactone lactonase YvrE
VGTGGLNGRGVFLVRRARTFCADLHDQRIDQRLSLCLQADADGNLWVGMEGGGLNRVRPKVFKVLEEGSVAQSLCPDDQGGCG